MTYLPKSKYIVKYTNGGELMYQSDNQEYIGPYTETSTGVYTAGPKLVGAVLLPIKYKSTNIDGGVNPTIFTNINSNYYSLLSPKTNIPPSKNFPTEKDYEKGEFIRNFIMKVNEPGIIYEIDKDTFAEYQKKNQIDTSLYSISAIKWNLIGEDAGSKNQQNIENQINIYPFIKSVFRDPFEFVIEEEENLLEKTLDPNQMSDQIPSFTLKQWNMFSTLDKEKLIIKYGEINISDLEVDTPTSNTIRTKSTGISSGDSSTPNTNLAGSTGMSLGGASGGGGGGY